MSGEGHISGTSPRWRFDQRPGTLEAARGLLVIGSRAKPGWTVLVAVRGEDGTFCQVPLSLDDALAAAAELLEMVELLEGRIW